MKFVKSCLGLIVVVVVIVVIIAVASGGGGSKDKTDRTTATGTSSTPNKAKGVLDPETGKENRVVKGKAYTLGDFKIHKGWKVTKDFLGYNVKGLEVENVTKDDHSFSVDIKLHQGPHRIVASISCIADQAHAKDIVEVDCLPDGNEKKPYGYITVENSF